MPLRPPLPPRLTLLPWIAVGLTEAGAGLVRGGGWGSLVAGAAWPLLGALLGRRRPPWIGPLLYALASVVVALDLRGVALILAALGALTALTAFVRFTTVFGSPGRPIVAFSTLLAGPLAALGLAARDALPSQDELRVAVSGPDRRPVEHTVGAPAPAAPRTILLLTIDTLRQDAAGPTYEGLAARGLSGPTWSTAPWTLPALASLHTGLTPYGHGALVRPPVRGTTRIQGFDAPSLAEHLRGLGYATAAFVENPQVSRARGFARGFDVWDNPDDRDPPRALLLDPFGVGADLRPLTPKGRDPDARVTAADAWLTNQDRAFLWVHLLGPHLPYHHADTSPGTALGDALGDNPTRLNLDHLRRGSLRWTAALRADVRAAYRAEALRADAALGRLVAAHPDALVVYTADHGEELGEHGGWEHGHALWEEVVRVPLAIAGPGVTPGRFGAASLTDVTPTLLSLVRAGDTPALDGTPLLPGTATPAYIEDTLYLEEREAVVVWPYKLVRTLDGEDERLYDLSTDPNERRDVSAQHPDQLDALTTLLDAERARLGDTSTGSVGERARALGYVE